MVDVNYLQRDLFPALEGALRPRGVLVFETFARPHLEELDQRMNPAYVLATNELVRAFPSLVVKHYHEGVVLRDGAARGVAGLVAQRIA